jgi:capsular polysaccharide biosynthesis protein
MSLFRAQVVRQAIKNILRQFLDVLSYAPGLARLTGCPVRPSAPLRDLCERQIVEVALVQGALWESGSSSPPCSSAARSLYSIDSGHFRCTTGAYGICLSDRNDILIPELSPDMYPWQKHRAFRSFFRKPTRLAGTTLVLAARFSRHNYFHWLIETIGKALLIRNHYQPLSSFDHIIISTQQQPYIRETLRAIGIAPSQIMDASPHDHFTFEKGYAVNDEKNYEHVHPELVTSHRSVFVSNKNDPQQMIYAARGRTKTRRVLNEDEIIKKLKALGLKVIHPADLSVSQQAEAFASSKLIIAPHGAALANLVFCGPGTTIIEMNSPAYRSPCYKNIAHHLSLRHIQLFEEGNQASGNPRDDNYSVNVDKLIDTIRMFLL